MSEFKDVYKAMEAAAASLGWTLAVADQRQDAPEQWALIATKENPAEALFGTLGVKVSDGLATEDKFGG